MLKQRCIRLLLLASAIASSFTASAYDFESDGLYYNINDDKETVTVTNKGDNIITYEGDIAIPTNVTYENKVYKVTEINSDAFRACSSLTSIVIPNGIEKIGDSAFKDCTSLTSVVVPGSVKELSRTFSGCSGLKSAILKSGVEILGTEVFSYCSSLTDIQLEEGLKYVCICAINHCYKVKSLVLPSTVIDVSGAAFQDSPIVDMEIKSKTPPYVSNAGYYLRMDDMFIKVPKESIELYRSTEHWKDLTYYCYSKKEKGITYIIDNNYAYAYKSDDNLSSVEILSSIEYNDIVYPVKKVMHDTFKDKTNLTTVSIPINIVSIDKSAFEGCSNLINVELPESLQNIGEAAFKNCGFADITLPESLKTLGSNAFEQCVNLTSISIPSQIKTIPIHCFNIVFRAL